MRIYMYFESIRICCIFFGKYLQDLSYCSLDFFCIYLITILRSYSGNIVRSQSFMLSYSHAVLTHNLVARRNRFSIFVTVKFKNACPYRKILIQKFHCICREVWSFSNIFFLFFVFTYRCSRTYAYIRG